MPNTSPQPPRSKPHIKPAHMTEILTGIANLAVPEKSPYRTNFYWVLKFQEIGSKLIKQILKSCPLDTFAYHVLLILFLALPSFNIHFPLSNILPFPLYLSVCISVFPIPFVINRKPAGKSQYWISCRDNRYEKRVRF